MADDARRHAGFLGHWELIPESCQYDQGDPPRSGSYEIREQGQALVFTLRWVDAEGQSQVATLEGQPDGRRTPFAGGALADALSITAVSNRELNSCAYREGEEVMVAQRQLDQTGSAMRVVQVVRVDARTSLVNSSVYRRRP